MAAKPPRGPSAPVGAGGPLGWEQSEEVAKRLLEDMKAAEAREKAARARDKAEGRAVAEAHAHGVAVERDWEQEEEIYQRLSAEMAALEARGFGVARVPSAQSFVPKLAPGQAPPLPHLAAGPPPHRTPSVQAALDHPSWEQEEEVYQRLAAELAELEERRKSAPKAKWIPKGPKAIVKSPSTEAVLAHPPWEQEQEVYERLVQELIALESRADARAASAKRGEGVAVAGLPSVESDQKAYDTLQKTLREMEARDDTPATAGAMRRSSSRGALLPPESGEASATGVHQRL